METIEDRKYTYNEILIGIELERIFRENSSQLLNFDQFETYEGFVQTIIEINQKYQEDYNSNRLQGKEKGFIQDYVARYIDENFLNKKLWKEEIELLTEIKDKIRDFNELDGAKIDLHHLIADIEEIIKEIETESKEN